MKGALIGAGAGAAVGLSVGLAERRDEPFVLTNGEGTAITTGLGTMAGAIIRAIVGSLVPDGWNTVY